LINKLQKTGFIEKRISGAHVVLFNNEYGSTIVILSFRKNKIIEKYILLTVRKNLVGKGVLNSEEFIKLLEEK